MYQTGVQSQEFIQLRLSQIERASFLEIRSEYEDDQEFVELLRSIMEQGLLEPLIVRKSNSQVKEDTTEQKYELICGYRRYLACRRLGIDPVPCVVMNLNDRQALEASLVENTQRKSLNPIEEAEAFKSYVFNFGRGSISRLAERIGKSEEYVSHRLLLLGLPKPIQDRITKRMLDPSHAMELVWLKDVKKQLELYELISKHNLSLRELRSVVRKVKDGISPKEAVKDVVKIKQVVRIKDINTNADAQSNDSWPYYTISSHELRKDKKLQLLDKAIILIRGSLTGLDFLIHESEMMPDIKKILMENRQLVHGILDGLITQKIRYKRNRTESPIPA
ncbi:MAG: ParB/RepB/Spo0J family partition protein [Conexivisphaerales archaeon]